MTAKEFYQYLLKRLQLRFPALDFSEHSVLSKMVIQPLATAFYDLYDEMQGILNLDDATLQTLMAKLYGIELEEKEASVGYVDLVPTGTTPINIPLGTIITDLNTGSTGVVAEEIKYTIEEVLSLKARNAPIKVPFRGNLPMGATVSFSADIGEYSSAVVVKEYEEEQITPPQEAIQNILENRPLLFGDSTKVAIEKKLSAFNAEVLDPMNPINPAVIFDTRNTVRKYKFVTFDPDTLELTEVDYTIEVGDAPLIIYGAVVKPE